MKDKTQIEKMIDAIESKGELKACGSQIIKEDKINDWDKEVEESPYNEFFGVDVKCALIMMKAIKRGLPIKDVIYMSEHHYKVPASRTGDLLHEYSNDGEEIYNNVCKEQRKALHKRLFYTDEQY